jgi:hypothetical protein
MDEAELKSKSDEELVALIKERAPYVKSSRRAMRELKQINDEMMGRRAPEPSSDDIPLSKTLLSFRGFPLVRRHYSDPLSFLPSRIRNWVAVLVIAASLAAGWYFDL